MTSTFPTLVGQNRPRPMTCLGDGSEIVSGGRSEFYRTFLVDQQQYTWLRKLWEWDFIADSAEILGLLDERTTAVGLGVGNEPLIYYFARRCARVIATDLYTPDTSWSEARVATLEAIYSASPLPYPRERLEIRNADMRALGLPDASADFAWSCSSVEHVPTLRDVTRCLDELARVLKDGGYAILTTEFCVTEPPYLLPGVNAWDPGFVAALQAGIDAFEFLGPTNLSYNWVHPTNWLTPRQVQDRGMNHRLHNVFQALWQTGTMLAPAGISGLVPIAMVLRRRPRATSSQTPLWERLRLPGPITTYTDAVERLKAGDAQGTRNTFHRMATDRSLPLQFRVHSFRFYAEATAITGAIGLPALADEVLAFCAKLPAVDFQDGDCVDLFAYLVGEAGRAAEAMVLTGQAMRSPSTTQGHAVRLAARYIRAARACGKLEEARSECARMIAGFLASRPYYDEVLVPLRATDFREQLGEEFPRLLAEVADAFAAKGGDPRLVTG